MNRSEALSRGALNSLFASLLLILAAPILASDLDVTMRMVEDTDDLTGSVAQEIRLPDLPALSSDGKSGEPASAIGRERARDARERGREFGQSASERARDARRERPGSGPDGLPAAAGDARNGKPEMPGQSSRP